MTDSVRELESQIDEYRRAMARLTESLGRLIVGQSEVIEQVLIAVVAAGHVLLEGAPGLGKTLLVRSVAEALELDFSRIQFTPDLMPADITGTNVVVEERGQRSFRFQKGPLFANIVLADEINRATPKTQSALLEAMQEATVTAAGIRHPLPDPFIVLATQNPIEMEGTYPLPEAQLDRFLLKLLVPFPDLQQLGLVLDRTCGAEIPRVERVLTAAELARFRALARDVVLAQEVRDHAARLVLATHPGPTAAPMVTRFVRHGASPRGAQALILSAKARAASRGRPHVGFEDITALARPALRHRIILNLEAEAEGIRPDDVLAQVLEHVTPGVKR